MHVRQGSIRVYDNFKVGLSNVPGDDGGEYIGLAFVEPDFDGTAQEDLNPVHIFKFEASRVDDLVNMMQKAKGSKVVLPDDNERRTFGK